MNATATRRAATCDFCQTPMNGSACTFNPEIIGGKPYDRIPYDVDRTLLPNCVDCRTPQGGLHHPGCDGEQCARCGGQAISCPCTGEDEEAS